MSEKFMIFYYNCLLELKVIWVHITQVLLYFQAYKIMKIQETLNGCSWLTFIIHSKLETQLFL